MPSSPGAHVCQQGHQLYGNLRQTVDGFLLVSRIACTRQKPLAAQTRKSIGENVGSDSFLGKAQQLSVVPTITEHDVSDHDQAPTIAEHFEGEVDRAPGAAFMSHASAAQSPFAVSCLHFATRTT